MRVGHLVPVFGLKTLVTDHPLQMLIHEIRMDIEIVTTRNDDCKETGFGVPKACSSILDAIERMGHQAALNVCQTRADLDKIVQRKPDLVILAVKYLVIPFEDDIWLSEYFAKHDINFSGSSRDVLQFDSDKLLAKARVREKGLRTADYFIATPGQYSGEVELPIGFPLFLKPSDSANGNGIDDSSFVTNFADFERKVLSINDAFDIPTLAEEYLDGAEYTVAILKTLKGSLLVSPIEIVPVQSGNGLRILGQKAKRDDSEELRHAADCDTTDKIKELAIAAFLALGVRDFGRIDIKTNACGQCFFLEANLVPGMTLGTSYFPRACEMEHGLGYDEVIALMLEEGLGRAISNYEDRGFIFRSEAGPGRDLPFAQLARSLFQPGNRSHN
jgi:D-alanine-D-alanine ligase